MQADDTRAQSGLMLDALRHRAMLIALCGVLGLLAGLAFSTTHTSTYRSTASVLVNPIEGNPFAPASESDNLVSLETEAQVVPSDAVTSLALNRLPAGATRAALQAGVSVVVPPNTQVLQITFIDANPVAARNRAQAYATAYLDFRQQRGEEALAGQLAGIDDQLAEVTSSLRTATAAAATAAASGATTEQSFQEDLAQALNDELVDLRASRVAAQSAAPQAGKVISPADLPAGAAGLGSLVFVLAGLVVGLLAGLALALARERKSDKLYDGAAVERAGVPVLATMPRRQHNYRNQSTPDEIVRQLRAMVITAAPPPSVIAVTCASRAVFEPGIAARLSVSMRKAWASVILIDADEGVLDPTGVLEDVYAPGVSDALLSGDYDPRDYLVTTSPRLRLMTRGERFAEAVDRFLPRQLDALMRPLRADSDFVVVRAPSVLDAAGQSVVSAADVTLLVVVPGVTTHADLAAAVEAIRRSGRPLLGAVLSPAAPRRGPVGSASGWRPVPVDGEAAGQDGDVALRGERASRPSPT